MLNMASSEFPLRTNYELTRILHAYNGTNEVEIKKLVERYRVSQSWQEANGDIENTHRAKTPPPHGYHIYKGSAYCVLSRNFVEFVVTNKNASDLLAWAVDTYSPDEWYISQIMDTHRLFLNV